MLTLTETQDPPENFLAAWPEDGAFYQATQHTIPGFDFGYLTAVRNGMRVAVVPYFVADFKLATMLGDSWLRYLLGRTGLRIACVGHPTAAFGRIDGQVDAELIERVFAALREKAPLVAFKGFGPDLPAPGFTRTAGLPVATLKLEANFWNTVHTHKQRNDLTRKLKAGAALHFEECDGLPVQYRAQVYQLYLNTYRRAALRFECLSPAYFSATAALSFYVLAFLDGKLVGFVQMLGKGRQVIGKYGGLDYSVSREHKLYFSLVLHALEACGRRGYREAELGETSYAFKKSLGCELADTWIYYRHRRPLLNALLAHCAFLLRPDRRELE